MADLLLHESEALPLVEHLIPPERVLMSMCVCTRLRLILLSVCQSSTCDLQITLRVRCRRSSSVETHGDDQKLQEDTAVDFCRFGNARLRVAINPVRDTCVLCSVFSQLYRAVRSGKCAGPLTLDLSGCYWSYGDGLVGGMYGPQLDEAMSSTVIHRPGQEQDIYQAIAYSKSLRKLVWANVTPVAEALDIRPMVSSLGTSLTHLGPHYSA